MPPWQTTRRKIAAHIVQSASENIARTPTVFWEKGFAKSRFAVAATITLISTLGKQKVLRVTALNQHLLQVQIQSYVEGGANYSATETLSAFVDPLFTIDSPGQFQLDFSSGITEVRRALDAVGARAKKL